MKFIGMVYLVGVICVFIVAYGTLLATHKANKSKPEIMDLFSSIVLGVIWPIAVIYCLIHKDSEGEE